LGKLSNRQKYHIRIKSSLIKYLIPIQMKINKYIVLILILILVFPGCVSLDEELEDSFGHESMLSDSELASKYLNAAYSILMGSFTYYTRPLIMPPIIASDDSYFSRTDWPGRINIDEFIWDPTESMYSSVWSPAYASITICNTFIDNFTDGASEDVLNNSLGEAHFLRALNYFNLAVYFGNIPLVLDSKLTADEIQNTTQAPIEDVYDQIVADLLLSQNIKTQWDEMNVGRPTRASAMALLGKVYLYMASPGILNKSEYYTKAAEIFKELNTNAAELGIGLLPTFQEVFYRSAEYSQEMVFELGSNGPGLNNTPNLLTGQVRPWIFEDIALGVEEGWGMYIAEMDLYNCFSDKDDRKEVSFVTQWIVDLDFGGQGPLDDTIYYYDLAKVPELTASSADDRFIGVIQDTTPHCGKWRWPDNVNILSPRDDINVPVIRYADCLLMWSEAELMANGATVDALTGINMVRDRANLDELSGLGKDQLMDSIRMERRRELAFELGYRWFDLVRWDIQGQIPALVAKGVGNKKYFPIPQDEINASGGILIQNPEIP
jgi:starch-binding outer membrane protein, SusD/RagB family